MQSLICPWQALLAPKKFSQPLKSIPAYLFLQKPVIELDSPK